MLYLYNHERKKRCISINYTNDYLLLYLTKHVWVNYINPLMPDGNKKVTHT